MFTRARLHLTLLFAGLLGVTVIAVAGAIGFLAVREAHATDDRELQIRANAIAAALPAGPPQPSSPQFDRDGGNRPPESRGPGGPHPEEFGLLEYVIPVFNGQPSPPPPSPTLPGLPNLAAAQQSMQTGKPSYTTLEIQGSKVRLYSTPVISGSTTNAIVQVARSQYFVDAAVTQLALIALIAGVAGVAVAGAAGYLLAGRTLQPIAAALERQKNFAADASHELRTPLTVLLTNAELLTRHPERTLADYQDVVDDMLAEIRRLGRLVADLLTLARADQGKAVLVLSRVDLAELVETVVRQFAPLAEAKGLRISLRAAGTTHLSGDRDRLQQLVVILVDNAVRYTKDGSIEVSAGVDGHDCLIEVKDTGPGIAAEHLPHLFDRFYRTDAARSADGDQEPGSGLGLSLAQWIVDAHHGRIEVTSRLGSGTTFTAHLPQGG